MLKKYILIGGGILLVALGAFFFLKQNKQTESVQRIDSYTLGTVITKNDNTTEIKYLDDNLEEVQAVGLNLSTLTNDYIATLKEEKEIWLPYSGSPQKEKTVLAHIDNATGKVDYVKDDVGTIDTVCSDGKNVYYSSNYNGGGYIQKVGEKNQKSEKIENALVTNCGILKDEVFLITHTANLEDNNSKDGTKVVFYDKDLKPLREYSTEEFIHRGPSVVYQDKIYFMSSNIEKEDQCIYSVTRDGVFEKIALPFLAYRIEKTPEGILVNGGDDKVGSYILIKENGEQVSFPEQEKSFIQMKWIDGFLYTFDDNQQEGNPVIRKYSLKNDKMELILEKTVDIDKKGERVLSIF